MSLGSNRVDSVRSLQKIPTWLHGTNFYINCTSSHCFAPSFMQLRNDPKWTQTLCKSPKHEFRVQWSGLGAFVAKNPDVTSWHPVFHRVSCSYETIPNAPKHYATDEHKSLGAKWVDWVRSLRKIPTWLRGTNLCINCTIDPILQRVSCSYQMIPNAAKHYETHQNMSLGSNGVDWVCSLPKILTWLRGTLFFIEFHAVTKRSQIHPNTMQWMKTWV